MHRLLLLVGLAAAESFDYVIVGAGTSGLVLANRLSEDPRITVAVVDPGADQRSNPLVTDPAAWIHLQKTAVDWAYSSVPQAGSAGRTIDFPAGKGIGGTSLINGMTYIRGDKAEFDIWETLGNKGWNWDSMYEHFKSLEKFIAPEPWQQEAGASYEAEYHGTQGEIHVGFTPALETGPFFKDAAASWAALGQSRNTDVDSGSTAGFDVWPQTLDPKSNTRSDAATSFYWPVQGRKNLRILNGTVLRVTWKDCHARIPVASGVEYINPSNEAVSITATKEVILSAGALRTPLILEASGVGNPKILQKLGVETVVENPNVGENMIDQPNILLLYASKFTTNATSPYATFVKASELYGDEFESIAASTRASLPAWAKQAVEASEGALNATAVEKLFELQHDLIFQSGATIGEILSTASGTSVLSAYWPLLPFSRGSVHLTTTAKPNEPAIDPRYLQVDHDLQAAVAIGRLCQRFWATAPVASHVDAPISPDATALPPNNATDEQWASFLRGALNSNSHSLGTAAMMARELGGVVDGELRVYGAGHLRVVDASVLPMQISGHLTATLYAVAARAAEMMLGEEKKRR